MDILSARSLLLIAAIVLGARAGANEGTAQAWQYHCQSIDRQVLLGWGQEVLTYGRISDIGTASYVVTVYRDNIGGKSRVRVIGFTGVPEPGCRVLLIENLKLDDFVREISKHKELSLLDQHMFLKQADGIVSLISLRNQDGTVSYYSGNRLGPKLLELSGAAPLLLNKKTTTKE